MILHGRDYGGKRRTVRLTASPPLAYAQSNDSFRPHPVGLAPRAERERRLLTERPRSPFRSKTRQGLFLCA
jgi:hypothetical protein